MAVVPRHLLDTQIVEYGWRYRIASEDTTVPAFADPSQARLSADLGALEELFELAQRYGALEFRVAPESLRELADSPEVDASDVMSWAQELAFYAAPDDWPHDASSRRQAPLFDDFVRPGDSILVAEVLRLECDGLLTCDYRLHRQRLRIKRVAGVSVLRPSELAPHVLS
jgi:hypothetical protein